MIQRKTKDKDGYEALQLGLVEDRPAKPDKAHARPFLKSGAPRDARAQESPDRRRGAVKEGDQFFVDLFKAGEKVHVTGTEKGKGFAGVVKRHHFRGGGASHGSMFHRAPGSIGASSYPSRVVKGLRMGGRMGTTG